MKIESTAFHAKRWLQDEQFQKSVQETKPIQLEPIIEKPIEKTIDKRLVPVFTPIVETDKQVQPETQQAIQQFEEGHKLNAEQMRAIREQAPSQAEQLASIAKQREVVELQMQAAPSKAEALAIATAATEQLQAIVDPRERTIRTNQLVEARRLFEQTEQFANKPNVSPANSASFWQQQQAEKLVKRHQAIHIYDRPQPVPKRTIDA